MPSYDSESSDGGDNYTETNVLLGYASKEPTGDTVSHLGGWPTWLDDKAAPSGALSKCKVCNGLLTLLLELNGDLPEHFPGHERRLYIFTCRRKTCRRKEGGVRGIRGIRIAKGSENKTNTKPASPAPVAEGRKEQKLLGELIFGVSGTTSSTKNPFANPIASNSNGKAPANPFASLSSTANPFSTTSTPTPQSCEPTKDEANSTLPETFAQKARLSSPPPPTQPPRPHEPWPQQSAFPSPYPSYYLDAEYETLDAPSKPQIPDNARMDMDADGSGGVGKEDKEAFESTLDKTFQKFADRVGQNAEQVLRYEFRGKPLLYSDSDAVGKLLALQSGDANAKMKVGWGRSGIPQCGNCGAERVFEIQLTPHAITELEAEEMGIEGMEWGTIILGVCGRDCAPSDVETGEVGYVEEWMGVQWEEVAKR
ncbi:hypothetical protein K469DRAFT_719424 [Zopfia rhizophila CBS 207.26]|uniref:Programmed cell death protein 2 C-terminal domain-containing protein n=1 Tax=Zopfia rhizophila CBS 207.26 TaxID=1314779 RepID=A0A6A6DFL7_9PEZI|nr:hypothetical protein K469DRAFT_719424 [Zopfia rhizophila CBS 207.26]